VGLLETVKIHDFNKFLESYGYYERRQTGSHAIYKKDKGGGSITIAIHGKEVPFYVIRQVIDLLKITREEFEKEIKDF